MTVYRNHPKKHHLCAWMLSAVLIVTAGCEQRALESGPLDERLTSDAVPSWAAEAIIYQIFPERFRNGDPTNDPTRESLEYTREIPSSWAITDWTGDWYARDDWEYEISDEFYESIYDRRYGGDLQGVIDGLPYLDSLGINVIYFNPVFWARSLHKYDGNTFHHIDPYFGPDPDGDFALMNTETADPATWGWTAADRLFLDLIEDAHDRGIRVIIDGVWNHTGLDFFAFADIRENQEASPYADWYIIRSFDDPETPEDEFDYEGWWGVKTLPLFADAADGKDLHPGPKAYVFASTARWMDPNGDGDPSDGIDGWRLDVANEVPMPFWTEWNAHVRSLNPDAYTVTEVWDDAGAFLRDGGFSATMNYYAFAFPVKGYLVDGSIAAKTFVKLNEERSAVHDMARQYAMMNMVDSHDTDRLASMIVDADSEPYLRPERFDFDESAAGTSPMHTADYPVRKPNQRERHIQRLVALMQMTWTGAPTIYYGTEAGMWGADDPDDRMPMTWPGMVFIPQTHDPKGRNRAVDEVGFDADVFDFYREAIWLRRNTAALNRGKLIVLHTEGQFLAFERTLDGERIVIMINRSEDPVQLQLQANRLPADQSQARQLPADQSQANPSDGAAADLGPPSRWHTLLTTRELDAANVITDAGGGAVTVRLPGITGVVYHLQSLEEE